MKVIGLRALWKLSLHDHWNTSMHGFLLFRPFEIAAWNKKEEREKKFYILHRLNEKLHRLNEKLSTYCTVSMFLHIPLFP